MALTKIKSGGVSSSIALDSPDINTPDIDGGTIDGTVIGGATPAAISGTTGQFATSLNVDGTATMDGLTVDGESDLNATVTITHANPRIKFIENDSSNANTQFSNDGGDFAISTMNDAESAFTKRFNLDHATGDISFYEDTGTTPKLFWDASAENLGVGTAPASTAKLHISSGVNDTPTTLRIENSDNTIETNQEVNAIEFYTKDASASGTGVSAKIVQYAVNPGNQYGLTFSTYNVGSLEERLRLDATGNLLVDTLSTTPYLDSSGTGMAYRTDYGIFSVKSSGTQALTLNRTGSNGAIAEFRKSGTSVGSIGNFGGDLYIGTEDVGLHFYDYSTQNAIMPHNPTTNATADALIDLGRGVSGSPGRFKDLYLSGGVYLGGTGAANKLSDVETGTWTPVIAGSGGGAYTYTASATARYTKIGNLVTLSAAISNITTNGGGHAGYVQIQGAPFNKNSSTFATGAMELSSGDMGSGQTFATVSFISANSGSVMYVRQSGDSSGGADFPVTGINSGTTDFNFTITYQTA